MTLSRRRFLAISAAALGWAGPAAAVPLRWQGHALGAEIAITLHAPQAEADAALAEVRALLNAVEAQFSLYDPASALSVLNRQARLDRPTPMFVQLTTAAGRIHSATQGLFDPTLQPLWQATAQGAPTDAARAAIGWHRVGIDALQITLGKGQALTFNGIAQGFATDLVTDALRRRGMTRTLINIGEYRGLGGPWRLGLEDPTHGSLGLRTLSDAAIATSSPTAMPLGTGGHILHGSRRPRWSTISVEAADATTADGYSTAMTLASRAEILAMKQNDAALHRITLVDLNGDLTTL